MEGAPSGLHQEEGEADGNSPSSPVLRGCLGQKTASQGGKVFPEALTASVVDAGWLESCGCKAALLGVQ